MEPSNRSCTSVLLYKQVLGDDDGDDGDDGDDDDGDDGVLSSFKILPFYVSHNSQSSDGNSTPHEAMMPQDFLDNSISSQGLAFEAEEVRRCLKVIFDNDGER